VDARYHWMVHDLGLRSSVEEALSDLEALDPVESSAAASQMAYTREMLADPAYRTRFGPAWAMLCQCLANASHNLGIS
jgi:hypothetical protein